MIDIFRKTVSDIDWYCELRGSGPPVVLIPSGEGDCGIFARVAESLATQFTVFTFDMPGFSRTTAPKAFGKVTSRMLSEQIAELATAVNLVPATFLGCSSGALAALNLAADHPAIVRNVIVHEAALINDFAWRDKEPMLAMQDLGDESIIQRCRGFFRAMTSNPDAWDALGGDYHQRLDRNYVTWIRHYAWSGLADRSYTVEELSKRPLAWSVGGFTEVWKAISNLRVAERAKLPVEILRCKHFPQIEIPDVFAEFISTHTAKQLATAI